MIGFGELNEEFGNLPPYLISIEEVNEEGYATNSLNIKIETDTGIIICIEFDSYIMHMTRNESYTSWDNYEVRKGNYLVDFTKSRFNDFYDDVIIHTEDYSYPGRGHHYGIYTCDHIIDVLSNEVPKITVNSTLN
ncbi:MAG: hypothetical protein MJ153_00315 [Clostridia bacterium]|nr:hypothetical protein [Clostridia bacterium]